MPKMDLSGAQKRPGTLWQSAAARHLRQRGAGHLCAMCSLGTAVPNQLELQAATAALLYVPGDHRQVDEEHEQLMGAFLITETHRDT